MSPKLNISVWLWKEDQEKNSQCSGSHGRVREGKEISVETKVSILKTCISVSQAARQGLAVLMASAVVVLKYVTSTLRKSHNFLSIDCKFGVGDYVREVTSPAKFGLDLMSGRDATWEATYTGPVTFLYYSSTELQPIAINQFSRTVAQNTRSGVRNSWVCEGQHISVLANLTLSSFIWIIWLLRYIPLNICNKTLLKMRISKSIKC